LPERAAGPPGTNSWTKSFCPLNPPKMIPTPAWSGQVFSKVWLFVGVVGIVEIVHCAMVRREEGGGKEGKDRGKEEKWMVSTEGEAGRREKTAL
jgi:hypothetical protein